MGIVYRPPGTDLKLFIDEFGKVLNSIRSERKLCYLLGDWNINLLSYDNHVDTSSAIDMFYSYSFMPLINRPTRISATSATIIDNIFTNNHTDLVNSYHGILITDISDHFPIFHINKNMTDVIQEFDIVKRFFSAENKQSFIEQLSQTDWTPMYSSQNTQSTFSIFHQTFCELFNKSFPKRKVKIRYNNYKPWLSDSLKRCIKHKNRLYYTSIKIRTAYNELMYSTYRNKLKNVLIKAEREYYAKLLEANKSSMKKTWSIIKQIINKKKHSKTETQFKLDDETVTSDQK